MPSITPYFPDSALKASAVKSEVDVLDIEEGFCFPACKNFTSKIISIQLTLFIL